MGPRQRRGRGEHTWERERCVCPGEGGGKHTQHRSRGEGECRPEEGQAQAAGEHTGGSRPRREHRPKRAQARATGGKGESMQGGVAEKKSRRGCSRVDLWRRQCGTALKEQEVSLTMQCPAATSHCGVAAGRHIIRRGQEEQAGGVAEGEGTPSSQASQHCPRPSSTTTTNLPYSAG